MIRVSSLVTFSLAAAGVAVAVACGGASVTTGPTPVCAPGVLRSKRSTCEPPHAASAADSGIELHRRRVIPPMIPPGAAAGTSGARKRAPERRRRDRAADHAGHGDQREDVRQRLE